MVHFKEKIKILVCNPLMYTEYMYLPNIFGILRNAVKYSDKIFFEKTWWFFPLYDADTFDKDLLKANPKRINVLCLSMYLWNKDKLLETAKFVKEQNPRCRIIIGGPEVNEEFEKYNYVDNIVIGECEDVFTDILKGNTSKVVHGGSPKLKHSYWLENKEYYEKIIERVYHKNKKPVVAFETDRGCPYNCSFCNWARSDCRKFPIKNIFEEIEWFCKKGIFFFEFTNSNFGMFDRDYDISKKIVEEKQKTFNPRYVVYSIAKSNLKNVMRITKLLTKHNLLYYNGIPIQSTDPTVLRIASRKNLPLADLKKVSDEINFTATPQIILGLPGDNFQRFSQTFVDLIEQGYRNFQVFPFLLLRNSPAYDAEYRKKYKIETIYRHNQRSRRKTHNKEGYSSLNEFVIKTFSFNREEYLKMWYFATFVSSFIRLINSKKPHREFFLELMKKFDFPEIRKKQKEFVYDGGFLEFEYPKISELTTQMYDSEEYMLIEILLNWNTYKKQLAKYDTKNQLDSVIHPDYTGPATHTGPNKEYKLDFIGQTGDEKLKRYVNCIIGTLYKRSARICT